MRLSWQFQCPPCLHTQKTPKHSVVQDMPMMWVNTANETATQPLSDSDARYAHCVHEHCICGLLVSISQFYNIHLSILNIQVLQVNPLLTGSTAVLACMVTDSPPGEHKAAAPAAFAKPHSLIQVGGGEDNRACRTNCQTDTSR